jgi:hypothetical protein
MWAVATAGGVIMGAGCRVNDILRVPPPEGIVSSSALNGQSSAEGAFYTGRTDFNGTVAGPNGQVEVSGWLTDEFIANSPAFGYPPTYNNIDARRTAAVAGWPETGDGVLQKFLAARSELLLALVPLQQYETGAGVARIGEAWALVGYTELLMAEDYCAGVPLSQGVPGGGVAYGRPLTTDSLLGTAEAHFELALAHSGGNDSITALASVGLGRTLLDRAQYVAAAAAVQSVPPAFAYNLIGSVSQSASHSYTLYGRAISSYYCATFNVADREGTNGLPFVSASDPRLVLDSTLSQTCDGVFSGLPDSVFYYPVKFGSNPVPVGFPVTAVPLATGLEASLIAAEAALHGGSGAWLADLNALRSSVTGLVPLTDPGTDTGRVSLMFSERAFWLFGTGTRLGDLRRLIRQYNRPAESVFPTGAYAPGNEPYLAPLFISPLTTYGTDVNLTLPTPQSGNLTANPYYKGCITSTTTA